MASLDRFDKLNPNQFALPGMEHHAHPFAKMLTHGLMVEAHPGEGDDPHDITAYNANAAAAGRSSLYHHEAGTIQWATRHDEHGYRPGEIRWVENTSKHDWDHYVPGVAEALYHTARHVDIGQDTRPVHSPDLTIRGGEFRDKVGGPLYRNKGAEDLHYGYHPFEQQEMAARQEVGRRVMGSRKNLNQLQFPGV